MTQLLHLLQRPAAVHGLILGVIFAYGLIRLTLMSALGGDEAEQVLFAQSLAWGYDVTNPPLYTWILSAVFSLFGKSAAVLLSLKLVVVGMLYITLYHAARMSLGAGRALDWALVGLSPILLFVVAWHAIFSYSHSLLNGVFVVLTFMVLLQIAREAHWRWYVLLGLVAGLGVLTKYSYIMFLIAVLVAGVSLPQVRTRLLNTKIVLTLIIALAIIAPHGLWLLDASRQMEDAVAYKLQMDQDLSYFQGLAKGLWNLIRASFAFLSPLWLVLLLVFPAFVKKPAPTDTLPHPFVGPLLGRTFLIVVALMVLMVLGGATQFRPNYLFLLILLPLWAFVRLNAEPQPGARRKVYAAIVLAGCAASVLSLGVKALTDPQNCKKCQHLMDYAAIAEELRTRGFEGGSILAHWYPNPMPGNLGLEFDTSRIVSTKFPTLTPPLPKAARGQCLLVTISASQGGSDMVNLSARAKEAFGLEISPQHDMQSFTVPYKRMTGHSVTIDYLLLNPNDADLADCR